MTDPSHFFLPSLGWLRRYFAHGRAPMRDTLYLIIVILSGSKYKSYRNHTIILNRVKAHGISTLLIIPDDPLA
jgi:hypothetical protein